MFVLSPAVPTLIQRFQCRLCNFCFTPPTSLLSYFVSVSGYDFGYLVKLLTDARLPEEEHDFFQILNLFFPAIYDVKYLMKSCKNLKVHRRIDVQTQLICLSELECWSSVDVLFCFNS